jgi:hypothetical protein
MEHKKRIGNIRAHNKHKSADYRKQYKKNITGNIRADNKRKGPLGKKQTRKRIAHVCRTEQVQRNKTQETRAGTLVNTTTAEGGEH